VLPVTSERRRLTRRPVTRDKSEEKYLDVQLVLAGWTAKLLRVNKPL
jgi:hypothetical protein